MEVAFSIGPKSLAVINKLKTLADNISFHTYPDIRSMVKEAMLRHISFDRIVFSTVLLQDQNGNLSVEDVEGDLRELNEFIKNYSDNTSIVLITNQGTKELEVTEIFKSMFNSPMYTPVIMSKTTPKNLLEIVTEDITTLKTKYYVLDVDKDKTIVSSNESVEKKSETETTKSSIEKKKKGGFFSGLMGGKKKSPDVSTPVQEVKQGAEDVVNKVEEASEISTDFSAGPKSVFNGFGGESSSNSNSESNNFTKNVFDSQNSSSSDGMESSTMGFSDPTGEDDMLSLGEMGEQHTDTGFLDEEEEENDEELQEYIRNQHHTLEEDKSEEPVAVRQEPVYTPPIKAEKEEPKKDTNIDMVLGMHGSGSTSAVVNEAMDLYQSKGAKVLIIDLDYRENGLLSFINVEDFYNKGYSRGISRRRIYNEDGIGILSNGYGTAITSSELLTLLRSGIIRKFDEVLIDCPIECLNIVTKDILKLCNILVFTNIDRSDLLSTSLGLTDRSTVSLDVERFIMKTCIVDCPEGKSLSGEDIDYIRDNCLFANGCWLDNYEQ